MKRRQFTGDVYLPTDYMTLEGFYKALQRDTGVDDKFFMWDYPVPENEEQYQDAVKFVRWMIENIFDDKEKKPAKNSKPKTSKDISLSLADKVAKL